VRASCDLIHTSQVAIRCLLSASRVALLLPRNEKKGTQRTPSAPSVPYLRPSALVRHTYIRPSALIRHTYPHTRRAARALRDRHRQNRRLSTPAWRASRSAQANLGRRRQRWLGEGVRRAGRSAHSERCGVRGLVGAHVGMWEWAFAPVAAVRHALFPQVRPRPAPHTSTAHAHAHTSAAPMELGAMSCRVRGRYRFSPSRSFTGRDCELSNLGGSSCWEPGTRRYVGARGYAHRAPGPHR
jgi:hypothetical protein